MADGEQRDNKDENKQHSLCPFDFQLNSSDQSIEPAANILEKSGMNVKRNVLGSFSFRCSSRQFYFFSMYGSLSLPRGLMD